MTPKELLRNARALIAAPSNWTVNCYARDAYNQKVEYHSPEAISFCALGALNRAYQEATNSCCAHPDLLSTDGVLHAQLGVFNDAHTHQEVLALYDRAIALAEDQ